MLMSWLKCIVHHLRWERLGRRIIGWGATPRPAEVKCSDHGIRFRCVTF